MCWLKKCKKIDANISLNFCNFALFKAKLLTNNDAKIKHIIFPVNKKNSIIFQWKSIKLNLKNLMFNTNIQTLHYIDCFCNFIILYIPFLNNTHCGFFCFLSLCWLYCLSNIMYYIERNMKSTFKKYEAYERLKGDCEKLIEKGIFKTFFFSFALIKENECESCKKHQTRFQFLANTGSWSNNE